MKKSDEKKLPTTRQLRAWVDEWQQRLSLMDWRVRIRWAKPFEIESAQARLSTNRSLSSALIRVDPNLGSGCNDDDYSPVEMRIIHELVHLHIDLLWDFDEDSVSFLLIERAIQSLARALYLAKYDDDVPDPFITG